MKRKKPTQTDGRIVQYEPSPGDNAWKVERFDELAAEFELKEPEISSFHRHASQSAFRRAWEIIRRLYGMNPLVLPIDSDADYLRVWSRLEVATKMNLDDDELQIELDSIKATWTRKKFRDGENLQEPIPHQAPPLAPPIPPPIQDSRPPEPEPPLESDIEPEDATDAPTPTEPPKVAPRPPGGQRRQKNWNKKNRREEFELESSMENKHLLPMLDLPPMGNDDLEKVMHQYGFSDAMFSRKDSLREAVEERRWFAERVESIHRLFDEPMVSSLARQAVLNELWLRRIEHEMAGLDPTSARFEILQETKTSIEKTYHQQWKQINEICPWADQVTKKVNFAGVLSDLIEAVQEYKSLGTNRKIDGLFTAYQIQVQLRESLQHGVRYRPGQVAAILEAMSPEALWDPNWKRSFTDFQCKQLDEGFKAGIRQLRERSALPLPDLESDGPDGEYPPLYTPPQEEPAENVKFSE